MPGEPHVYWQSSRAGPERASLRLHIPARSVGLLVEAAGIQFTVVKRGMHEWGVARAVTHRTGHP
jgi:hypothetical protein